MQTCDSQLERRCRCIRKWAKCPLHVPEILERTQWATIKKQQSEGERLRLQRGVDVPNSVKRRTSRFDEQHQLAMPVLASLDLCLPVPSIERKGLKSDERIRASERASFKPDSIFARRFPHLLQVSFPTKGD